MQPREALLKYAEKTENDKQWTAAWQKTQPKPVFSQYMDDEANPAEPSSSKKKKKY